MELRIFARPTRAHLCVRQALARPSSKQRFSHRLLRICRQIGLLVEYCVPKHALPQLKTVYVRNKGDRSLLQARQAEFRVDARNK